MKNYCCDSFKFRLHGDSSMGLSIRVIEVPEQLLMPGDNETLKAIVTESYLSKEKPNQFFYISFCPFCGQLVSNFLQPTDVNESYRTFTLF